MDQGRAEMTLVVDASVALSWLISRSDLDESRRSMEAVRRVEVEGAVVPALWFPEVANGLLIAERAKAASPQQTSQLVADLNALPIEMDGVSPESVQSAILAIARQTSLTAYDATYLELALRRTALLATFDRKLAAAARIAGVPLFGDPV